MPIIGSRGAGVRGLGFQGAGKPSQVTGLTATDVGTGRAYNNGAINLSWSAPASNGAPITGYLIERSTDNTNWSTLVANTGTTSTTYQNTGMASAVTLFYRVSAINTVGTGSASSSSSATVTTVPQAPTIGSATPGNGSATVSYTANATGGKTVTEYRATSTSGVFSGTGASPITVSGLLNGTSYAFTVRATNANGPSLESGVSNSVIPVNPVPAVTGGTLYSDATYYYRAFTTSDTLSISNSSLTCDVLAIGGGASGGFFNNTEAGGGGGSGSAVYATSQTFGVGNKTVTIGAGGVAQTVSGSQGNDGGNTSISGTSILAYGGGGGAALSNGSRTGRSKGTGGGGSASLTTVGAGGTVSNVSTGGTAYQFGGSAATSSTKNSTAGGGGSIGAAAFGRVSGSYGLNTWSSWLTPGASVIPGFQVILTGSSGSAGNYAFTVSSTSNLSPGMLVTGSGIPADTYVTSFDSATQVRISKQITSTFSGSVTFTANYLGGGGGGAIYNLTPGSGGYGFSSMGRMGGQNGIVSYGSEAKFGGGGGGASGFSSTSSRAGGNGLVIVRYLRSAVGG